ncbi:sodium:proton antiporter [Thiocapsa imhoffii]|uniref:Sodium:proton antiporter n=1 Tax=Thiocapsa imhoffii TaxID=382777 RepID=A0A9X0WKA9_9GAMM|nr:proton-conducting transporter membrane subunit [Thiocapsa imhoffii]MBK1646302.1 sodium:proton antiporter [Thiocapsa imhoffii]
MRLFLRVLSLMVVVTPAVTWFAWDGALVWPLFGGATLSFDVTPLASFFLLLLAMGAPLAALPMLRKEEPDWQLALFALLVLGMQGLLLAQDLVGFFIGWEIMTWSSWLLIVRSPRTDAGTAASYILFNLSAAFLLLAGLLGVYSLTGSFAIQALVDLTLAQGLVLVLLFGAAFLIKIGTLPLHLWIPRSYDQAPEPVTVVLSALVSKMGVYGLLLMLILFPEMPGRWFGDWLNGPLSGYGLAWIGVITSIVATFKAIAQDDMKRLLAYSSIGQLGYVTTAIGVGGALGISGALYHALVHTLVSLLLFISFAGIIAQTGQRRFNDLGELIYRMPISFFGVLIGIIALAGMPPLPGFASKFLIFVALIEAQWILLFAAVILSSAAAFLYCYKLIYAPFLGQANSPEARVAREAPWPYLIPQIILMGMLVGLGMFPGMGTALADPVLAALGLAPLDGPSLGTLATPYGGYDGVTLMLVFGIAFALVTALFYMLRGQLRRAGSRQDLSFAGEVPTPDQPLHYGAGMGRELRRIPLIGWILARSSSGFFSGLAERVERLAEHSSRLYPSQPWRWVQSFVVVFAVLLTWGLVRGGGL